MNVGTVVLLGIAAATAAGVAIAAGTNAAVAAPLAAIAVGAVAFLLFEAAHSTRWPSLPHPRETRATPVRVRSAYGAGSLGRLDVIAVLDSLERADGAGTSRGHSPEEIARLQALGPKEFREYLRARVSDLERRT